jgi:hypothetical protein
MQLENARGAEVNLSSKETVKRVVQPLRLEIKGHKRKKRDELAKR